MLQFGYSIKFRQNYCIGKGNSRTLSLDLYDQVDNLDKTSQFRFTPPTHTILAFKQALTEFWKEGGVEGRAARYTFMQFSSNCVMIISIPTILCNNNKNVFTYFRYKANRAILREELNKLGFKQLVPEKNAGYIITSYLCPKHPNFSFKQFYSKLSDKGICIDSLTYKHHVLF